MWPLENTKQQPLTGRDFCVGVATSAQDISLLEAQWRDLERRANNELGVFQSYDWVLQWCKSWCKEADDQTQSVKNPYVVCIYQNDQLVGLWPLQVEKKATVKVLSWLSAPALQYGCVLVDQSSDIKAVLKIGWQHLRRQTDADLLRLEDISKTSALHRLLSRHCSCFGTSKSSILDIKALGNWENYQANLKSTARRARRKRYNKFARQGEMAFVVHHDKTNFKRLAKTAVEWKNRWLAQHNWPNRLLADPRFLDFIKQLAKDEKPSTEFLNARSKWVAGELSLDGNPVAIEIGAVYQGRYFSFLGAFDSDYSSFSPGKIQIEAMINWAFENNLQAFDFLSVPSQYKADWTNQNIDVENFSFPCSLRGKMFHSVWVKRLRPAVKHGLSRIPTKHRKLLLASLSRQTKNA